MWSVERSALIIDNLCVFVALTTTGVSSKNGVGHFESHYSDKKRTICEFNPYIMYDNRMKVYTTTES